ncbi:MAG: hypothetical protein ACJ79E_10775 [Anaeromyxobacteraceae bacterium]
MRNAFLCLLVLAAAPARAMLAVPATVEDLARSSDAVVRGKVQSVSARWAEDQRRIFTYVEVAPTSVWRGAAPARVTVMVPGGIVGGIGQRVDGAPGFSKGEEVVVFLSGAEAGAFRVTGLAQGKFSVDGAAARPQLSKVTFAPRAGLAAGERLVEQMDVAELERRVRSAK